MSDTSGVINSVHYVKNNMNIQCKENMSTGIKIFQLWTMERRHIKTKHQVCREDTEEDIVSKTKQTQAELTLVQKVRSLPGHGRFHHTGGGKCERSIFHIDFSVCPVSEKCTCWKSGLLYQCKTRRTEVHLDSLVNQITKWLNDRVDVFYFVKCNRWSSTWGGQGEQV